VAEQPPQRTIDERTLIDALCAPEVHHFGADTGDAARHWCKLEPLNVCVAKERVAVAGTKVVHHLQRALVSFVNKRRTDCAKRVLLDLSTAEAQRESQ
jgi:hypothetical protein